MARAGLTPFEVLRSATLEPARYLGISDSAGAVSRGMLADLVLLDADPLASVSSLKRIHAVIYNGRLLDSGAVGAVQGKEEE